MVNILKDDMRRYHSCCRFWWSLQIVLEALTNEVILTKGRHEELVVEIWILRDYDQQTEEDGRKGEWIDKNS